MNVATGAPVVLVAGPTGAAVVEGATTTMDVMVGGSWAGGAGGTEGEEEAGGAGKLASRPGQNKGPALR